MGWGTLRYEEWIKDNKTKSTSFLILARRQYRGGHGRSFNLLEITFHDVGEFKAKRHFREKVKSNAKKGRGELDQGRLGPTIREKTKRAD